MPSRYSPPDGFADCAADAEAWGPVPAGRFHDVDVPRVGTVRARRPLPNAIPVLAAAVRAHPGGAARAAAVRADHLTLFLVTHLAPGEYERLAVHAMTDPTCPADYLHRVTEAVASSGTARPTGPSLPLR